MLSQVGKLGPKYMEWVCSPVDRKLRLFYWGIMENMSVTPWYLIPIVWIPACIFFIYQGWLMNQLHINGTVIVTVIYKLSKAVLVPPCRRQEREEV
jgi:hypothetical protein